MTAEVFRPARSEKSPGLILLHGADGPHPHAGRYERTAVELADHGYVVLMVHYFEATGTQWANQGTIGRNYVAWMDAISDSVSYILSLRCADGNRAGLVGMSLGASLALAEASRNHRVGAVAELSGAIPAAASAFAERLPPVLVAHGAEDTVVPAENASRLAALLKACGIPHEVCIYPGQGHILNGPAVRDWTRRVAGFFSLNFGRNTQGRAAAD